MSAEKGRWGRKSALASKAWGDLREALIQDHATPERADFAVRKIKELVSVYLDDLVVRKDRAPRKTDGELKHDLDQVACAASSLRSQLSTLNPQAQVAVVEALHSSDLASFFGIVSFDEVETLVRMLEDALVQPSQTFKVKRGRPTIFREEAFLVRQSCRVWRDATGQWPVATKRKGAIDSPLFETLGTFVDVGQEVFERSLRAAKGREGKVKPLDASEPTDGGGRARRAPQNSEISRKRAT